MESGRIFLSLGKHSGVCVPPDSPQSSCPPQDTGGQDDGSVDSPLVAQEALVSGIGESVAPPRFLPDRPDVIRQPLSHTLHKNPTLLHLTAWPLSGKKAGTRDSRNERLSLLPIALESPLESLMTRVSRANSPGTRTEPTCSAIFAHSLRESIFRESYDSRLAGYFAWCEDEAFDPLVAPLNRMVDVVHTPVC